MAVQDSEIKCYRSSVVNDTGSNGGRMSATQESDMLANSLFPNITEAQRSAGTTRYRKTFWKVANADNTELMNAKVFLERPTTGGDIFYIFPGTQTDLQSDISSPSLYGTGSLETAIVQGDSTVHVTVENGAVPIFRSGGTISISNYATNGDVVKEEYHVLSGDASVNGNTHSLSLNSTCANDYATSLTFVSSCILTASVKAYASDKQVTSVAGTFDLDLVTVSAIGGVEDTLTFTFSNSTTFSCVGTVIGSLGTGNINSTFAPNNPSFGTAYVTVPSSAWAGTWATNNTLVFKIHPAAIPVWEKQVVPTGCAPLSLDYRTVVVTGESA
jgi:hypothetical protein